MDQFDFLCMQKMEYATCGLFKKVKIHLAKIGCAECKWLRLNAQGSYIPWCRPLLWSSVGLPFRCMQDIVCVAC